MKTHRIFSLLACILVCGGCHTPTASKSLTSEFGANDPDAQMEFWHRLNDQKLTSNDDAFHALLMFASPDGTDPAADYAARVKIMKERKMLPASFDRPAEEAITRGTLAVVMSQALKIKGGLMMRLAGPTPRYAVKEMIYMGLLPPSSPNQPLAGSELVGIIGKMEDYQRGSPAETPAPQLPSEATNPAKH